MRRCPVNALEPFRLFGLQYEYLVGGVVMFVLLHIWFRSLIGAAGPFIALLISVPFALTMQKLTQDRPAGWLQHAGLVWFCNPKRARYWPGVIVMIRTEFKRRGVLPPADCIDKYEG